MNVLLPEPVAPTTATMRPAGIVTSKWSSTSRAVLVAERHVVEAHRERTARQRRRGRARDTEVAGPVHFTGQHRADAIVSGHRPRQVAEHEADEPQRPDHEPEQRHEADDLAGRRSALRDPPRAERDEQDRGERRQRVEHRVEPGPQHRDVDVRIAEPLGLDREAGSLGLLGTQRLHDDDAVDALVDHVRDVADEALRVRRRSLGAALVHDVERGDGREEQERDDAEHPVGREHPHRRDHDEHHRAARVGQRAEHLRRGLGVGLHVREQLTRGVGLEVRERLVLVPIDHSLTEDCSDPHLRASRVDAAQHHTGGAHGADDDRARRHRR